MGETTGNRNGNPGVPDQCCSEVDLRTEFAASFKDKKSPEDEMK